MNEQIKQRIAQLNNGEVPNGYEKTKIGTFPVGWKTTTLDKLLEFKNGVNADKEKYNSGVKMISVMDILTDSPIYYDKIKGQVDIDKKTLDTYSVTYGDILFQRSSETFEDAGKSNVYLDQDRTATYSGFVIRGKKKADYNPYFLNEALRIGQVRNQIIRNAAGSQHINVGQDSLAKIVVPLAPDAEQSRIAEILMKWDEAIELQEQYIQTLLSMKITYVDKFFCAPGEEKTKFDLLYKTAGEGGTPDTKKQAYYDSEDVPFVKIEHLAEKYITKIDSYISNLGLQKSGAWLVPENCLIFSNGATIGEASINKIPVATKQGILGIVPSDVIDVEYFYYLVKSKYFLSKVKKITTKGTMCTAYLKDINRLSLFIHEKEDQIKIAKILSSIDCLIEDEKRKVDLLKKQRKTLQQYLLNGIVRVK